MKGKFVKLLTLLMVASMFLAACGGPATQAPAQPAAPAATEAPAMTEAPAATEAPAMPCPRRRPLRLVSPLH